MSVRPAKIALVVCSGSGGRVGSRTSGLLPSPAVPAQTPPQGVAQRHARHAGVALEVIAGESFQQPQRVQAVLERNVGRRQNPTLSQPVPRTRRGEVLGRMARTNRAVYCGAVGSRQFAVGACANAQIVAEPPVDEVVLATSPIPRIGGYLVLRVAVLGKVSLAGLLHLRSSRRHPEGSPVVASQTVCPARASAGSAKYGPGRAPPREPGRAALRRPIALAARTSGPG